MISLKIKLMALFNRKFQEQLQNTLEEIRAEAFVDIKISSI